MLDPFSRGAIVAMSALCIVGAVVLAPVRVRGSNDRSAAHFNVTTGVAFVAAPVAAVAIRRDPFEGQPAQPVSATPAPTAMAAAVPADGAMTLARGDIGTLPSNLAQTVIPAVPGEAPSDGHSPRVTAVVTGVHPYAMVDTAGNHEIKGIGDRVNGTTIVAIDIDGVTLQGGQRLTVSPDGASQ